jgi:hypothetical protein
MPRPMPDRKSAACTTTDKGRHSGYAGFLELVSNHAHAHAGQEVNSMQCTHTQARTHTAVMRVSYNWSEIMPRLI